MKNLSEEDEYIRQFISELGTENPSMGFHTSIVKKLRPKQSISAYQSVISPLAWKIISAGIAVIIISILLFLPSGGNTLSLFDQVGAVTISLPKITLPIINISPIVIQSLVTFTLFASLTIVTTLKKWKVT